MQKDLSIDVYKNFKTELESKGFFDRRYFYYFTVFAIISLGFCLSLFLIVITDSLVIQILNALLLAFLTVQSGLIVHDLAHGQVFENKKNARVAGSIIGSVMTGLSESRWFDYHNEHHKEVNHFDHDPDISFPFSYTDYQRERIKSRLYKKYILKFQHYAFFLVLPLVYFSYIKNSLLFTVNHLNFKSIFEVFMMVLRYIVGFYLVFNFLPLYVALVFCFVYAYATGYYMGLVFAPNHKGMYIIPENEEVKWYHQIICTRNLYSTPFTFHFMGGLDYQIEHHLFPNIPRINYPKVAPLVKEFCKKNNLEYYETTWWESMKEIFFSLKEQAKKA